MNGVYDIALGRVSGELTDHYAPNQSIVNLSTGTADSRSVAAAAVAAHEIGHVMQNKEGYGPYRVRTALVPVVNFGSRLAMPLVLIGILLDTYVRTANPDTGFYVAMVGVVLYGGSFLFSLVTLPVELDASRRAGEMLLAEGVIAEDEPRPRRCFTISRRCLPRSCISSASFCMCSPFSASATGGKRSQTRPIAF